MKAVAWLLRFDTEDPFTPRSDDAARWLAETLAQRGIRATFPITAWKLDALRQRRRQDVLTALARHDIGFHSTSHSLHPTLAEELAELSGREAEEAFRRREEEGFARVADACDGQVACYTQPGGNWAAEAIPALRAWGVPLYYSEAWNGYVDVAGRPFHLGGVLHWAAPVSVPKPFLSALPGALAASLDLARQAHAAAQEGEGEPGLVQAVAHPTELVTEEFWDVPNFRGGENHGPPFRRPRERGEEAAQAARSAFAVWLDALQRLPGAVFWSARDLEAAFPDRARGAVWSLEDALALARAWCAGQVGSAARRGVPLSPAEGVLLLACALRALAKGRPRAPLRVPSPYPPWQQGVETWPRIRTERVWQLAEELARCMGRLPDAPSGVPLATAAVALARLILSELAGGAPEELSLPRAELRTRRYVKPVSGLHWDWPIFRPGFTAPRLRERALAATWTLKPVDAWLCDAPSL